jgi:aspartyl-tRNA(Asn)/glutamyl-tRNA(Gln) amidotransferase subunit A
MVVVPVHPAESIEVARESIEAAGESLGRSGDDFHASVANARAKGFGSEVQRRVLVGTYVLGTDITSRYFDKAQRVRRKVAEEFKAVFSGGGGGGAGGFGGGSDMFGLSAAGVGLATGVDLLLTPTAPTCAPLLYGPGGADVTSLAGTGIEPATAGYAADAMTVPASLAGLPAASLPVGLGSSTGMPIGMQLIAPRGCDVELIGAAWHVERALAEAGGRGGRRRASRGGLGSENGGGGLAIGWGRDHRAQGTVDAVRFSAMGDFV